jgi:RHS repeat-associated protein
VELISYDAAGNPVELVDGEGGLTVLGRDVAGKITSITSPAGAVTRYEYDGCGRPWRTTDPLGAVTELTYDADQRVTARTLPTGEVETFEYDPCGRLVSRRSPGNGTARYGYDKCGRLTFSQDTWYGTRRFTYNTAGELISTVNGVGGRTVFGYDVRGRLIRITDPLGGATTRTYTATDQVDSVTDPLGRVTTATFDPAGRQLSHTDPDGHTTTWTYDAAGREATTSVDGKLVAAIERDPMRRRVLITDHTGGDGLAVEHELGFDRRGLLISRTRGGSGLSWRYDADGNRTGFTDAHGVTTSYSRDAAGRVTAVHNPLLGKAVFAHDACGRLVSATAGELMQGWVYRDGYLTEHTRVDRTGAAESDVTQVGRDGGGRITAVTRAGAVTRYGYDDAGQLVAASTTAAAATGAGERELPAAVAEWVYDAGGRLVREATPAGVRTYEYDAAGQLAAVTEPDGSVTEFVHDGLGRRIRLIGPDGSWTEYAWGPTGHLKGTCERTPDGGVASRHELWVDALGELAGVDGTGLWWDTANPLPTLAGIGGIQVLSLPGGVTGIGGEWTALGWRAARPTDQADPWAVLGTPAVPDPMSGGTAGDTGTGALSGLAGVRPAGFLPAGITLTGNGGLDVAGLEWLGARAYDPATRGFLSTDPLAPVLGAGWDGNPYAYAGNNPLNTTDPTGLRPLTDEELKAYDGSSRGAFAAAGDAIGDFVNEHAYVIGVAAIVAGVVLMCTGVGGPVGAAILAGAFISGGSSFISQKAANGSVDLKDVGKDAIVGAVGGAVGGAAAGLLMRGANAASAAVSAGATSAVVRTAGTRLGSSAVRSSLAAGLSGSASNITDYAFDDDQKRTFGGYVANAGVGFVTGAGGSAGVGKVASAWGAGVADRLPGLTPSVGRHELVPDHRASINWGGVATEQVVDRVGGAIVSTANTYLQPGEASRQEVVNGVIQGFTMGASGPTGARHSSGD